MVDEMRTLTPLNPSHYPVLYEIAKAHDPSCRAESLDHYINIMEHQDGWVVANGDEIIGCISFSDYKPDLDVIAHCFMHSDWHGRWITEEILKTYFGYAFNELNVRRVSTFSIVGRTDKAAMFIMSLGFRMEGVVRKVALYGGEYHDVAIFGMLREECRWV
jgi:RimJ/RimL family protein N-acetyltransferase